MNYALVRPNETKLNEMLENGTVSAETVLNALMRWLPDDELGECMKNNEIFEEDNDNE